MTPPAGTVAGTHAGATTVPRRRSGPAPRARTGPARPVRKPRPAPAPGAARVPAPARVVRGILDAPFLDRLVRGSGWIPLIALGLMGIVFMQVSMLKLNAGIGRAVESAATLERQNSDLRSSVSKLESNERVQGVAKRMGMVVPAAGSFRYVTARPGHTDAREAAKTITKPAPVVPGSTLTDPAAAAPAGTTPVAPVTPPATTPAPAATAAPVAPAAEAAPAPAPPAQPTAQPAPAGAAG